MDDRTNYFLPILIYLANILETLETLASLTDEIRQIRVLLEAGRSESKAESDKDVETQDLMNLTVLHQAWYSHWKDRMVTAKEIVKAIEQGKCSKEPDYDNDPFPWRDTPLRVVADYLKVLGWDDSDHNPDICIETILDKWVGCWVHQRCLQMFRKQGCKMYRVVQVRY